VWTQTKPKLRRDGIASIVDPCLKDEYAPDVFFEMADLALKCTVYEKDDRPTMRVWMDINLHASGSISLWIKSTLLLKSLEHYGFGLKCLLLAHRNG